MSTGAPHIHSLLAALFIQSADDQFSRRSTITSIRQKDLGQTERHLSPPAHWLFRRCLSYTALSHCREKALSSAMKPDVRWGPAVHPCGGIPHSLDMCVCICLGRLFCCTFSRPDCMLCQMQILGQLLGAIELSFEFDTNSLHLLRIVHARIYHNNFPPCQSLKSNHGCGCLVPSPIFPCLEMLPHTTNA